MAKPFVLTQAKKKKFEIVCERIASGESLAQACAPDGVPCKAAILSWLRRAEGEDATWLITRYARARDDQADHYADQIVEIADDNQGDHGIAEDGRDIFIGENVQRARLRVDARKWVASKLKPKKYADRLDMGVEGSFTVHIEGKDADCA